METKRGTDKQILSYSEYSENMSPSFTLVLWVCWSVGFDGTSMELANFNNAIYSGITV